MSAPKFFRLAVRMAAYPGVMHNLLVNEQREEQARLNGGDDGWGDTGAWEDTPTGGQRSDGDMKVIPLTPELAGFGMAALGLDGVVEYATST